MAKRGSDRSERGRLQATFGDLGRVQPFRPRVDDLAHPHTGWWVTPAPAAIGCGCELCAAARQGRDVYLGSISRMAHIAAGRLVAEHLESAA